MTGDTLTDRVRAALAQRTVSEVRMFGGLSFMVEGRMLVAVRPDDGLLARIDPQRHDELAGLPGASGAVMGKDRSMARGWIMIDSEHLETSTDLDFWLHQALNYHAAQAPRA